MLALIAIGAVLSIAIGSESLTVRQVLTALAAGGADEASTAADKIVWRLRLPRTLLSLGIGACLGVAGAVLQGVMRNALAAPNVVGVTAGAGLGATIVFTVAGAGVSWWLPGVSFAGAFIAALVVYMLAFQPGRGTSPVRLVLSGVALTAILSAFTTLLMIESDRAAEIVGWMAGSLNTASSNDLNALLPAAVVGLLGAALLWRPLDILQLGDEAAAGLGVRVERIRLIGMAVCGLLVGAAVSVAGLIGFVGLIVPHAMRLIVGPRHALLLPACALGGAALVVWADVSARRLLGSGEMPLGVLTSLIGGPYFLWLLHRARLVR